MRASGFDGVYTMKTKKGIRYFTTSIYPPFRGFDETIINKDGTSYREVETKRSKLFAAFAKGLSQTGIRRGSSVLYLGASHGYTPSFVSDMVGKEGQVYCLDVAPRVVRDLIFVCEARPNMAPFLADCRQPQTYPQYIPQTDVVFQDIAQRDQVDIFLKNVRAHLKKGGFGILALKARSIDVKRKPTDIFKEAYRTLERQKDIVIVDKRELSPLEKDHILFVIKKK